MIPNAMFAVLFLSAVQWRRQWFLMNCS